MTYEILLQGFPGSASRGCLGWSTVVLLSAGGRHALFDTGAAGDRPLLLSALRARGLTPDNIDAVVLSHVHFDHIANVECFPKADVILHEDELAHFQQEQGRDAAIPMFQVEGLLRRSKLTLVAGELDVLPGVHMIQTPGDTAGHCSLVLNDDGRTVVLAQDALRHRGEAEALAPACAFDPEKARRSIRRILALADVVVPGHDAALRVAGGRIASTDRARQSITITTDGRQIAIEA